MAYVKRASILYGTFFFQLSNESSLTDTPGELGIARVRALFLDVCEDDMSIPLQRPEKGLVWGIECAIGRRFEMQNMELFTVFSGLRMVANHVFDDVTLETHDFAFSDAFDWNVPAHRCLCRDEIVHISCVTHGFGGCLVLYSGFDSLPINLWQWVHTQHSGVFVIDGAKDKLCRKSILSVHNTEVVPCVVQIEGITDAVEYMEIQDDILASSCQLL